MTSVQSNYGAGPLFNQPVDYDYDDSDFDDKYAQARHTDHGMMYQPNAPSYDGSSVSGLTASSYDQQSADSAAGYRPAVEYQQFETSNYYGHPAYQNAGQYESYQQFQPQAQEAQAQATGKSHGGISAHISYKTDVMAKFICASAYAIFGYAEDLADNKEKRDYIMAHGGPDCFSVCKTVKPFILAGMGAETSVHTLNFKKIVKRLENVLLLTRLPHESIIIGLYYLAERVGKIPLATKRVKDETIYAYIIIAFILASKFHDDNTFVNTSWADVSHIPASTLTMCELEWLAAVDYSLFPTGEKFQEAKAWHELFKSYEQVVAKLGPRHEVWTDSSDYESPMVVPSWAGRPLVDTVSPVSSVGSRSYYGGSAMFTPPHSASSESRLSSSDIWSSSASSLLSQDGGWSRQASSVASPASSDHGPHTPPYDQYAKHGNNYHGMLQSWPNSTESFQQYSNNPYHQHNPVDTRNYGFNHLHMQAGMCGQGAFPANYFPSNNFLPPMVNATSW